MAFRMLKTTVKGTALAIVLALGLTACRTETPQDNSESLGIPDEISAGACRRAGGSRTGIVGQACVFPTPDAGKTCTDSTQCQSGCFTQEEGATEGQCAAFTSTFGCRSEVVNGVAEPSLCVD
jgi:hypothetical protein